MNCTGKRCPMQHDKVDPAACTAVPYCQYATPPKTNADRIRAMTDEELAEWFLSSGLPPGATKLVCHWDNRSQMKEEWLGWLKKGAEDEG